MAKRCFLASFSDKPCSGRLVRVHLIPRQLLKREKLKHLIADPRSWVWGCGGPMGQSGHHGMLDTSRTLRIPRRALPAGTEELGVEHRVIANYLDREYGPVA